MATARKLPSGSWRCQVYSHTEQIVQADGSIKKKRIYKSITCDIPGLKGKRQCERMAAEWAAEKEAQQKTLDITIGEAIDRYIKAREEVLSPRTIQDYRRIRKHDLQDLMGLKIATVSQEAIQQAINLDAQKHSPKTVHNNHGLISAVMRVYRPNFKLSTRLPKKVRPELYIPTDAEIQKLLEAVKYTSMELPVLLAAFGPMRRGEICALTSEQIDGNVVHVCRNMVDAGDNHWIIKAPKSYAGDRYIAYPDFVAEKFKGKEGRLVDLTPDMITDRFRKYLRYAGLPHFRFHDLRHYSASIQHALGIPDSYIMQRGGWENDATLKNIYRHTLSDRTAEMNRIANDHFSQLCNTKRNTDTQTAL